MGESSPSADEIASYFRPLLEGPNIGNILGTITNMAQIEEKVKADFVKCRLVPKKIEWEKFREKELQRNFKIAFKFDTNVDNPLLGYVQGGVELKEWSLCRPTFKWLDGTITIFVQYKLDFVINAYVSDHEGRTPIFKDTIIFFSSSIHPVGFVSAKLFRLWMRNQLFDLSLGVNKPNTPDSFLEYDSQIYPTKFVRLVRSLGPTAPEVFRDIGIMSPEVFEIVFGEQPRNTDVVQNRTDFVGLEKLLGSLENVISYEERMFTLSGWNKLGLGNSKSTALNTFRELEREGLVSLRHGATKGTAFRTTEKGKRLLRTYREEHS